MENIKEVLELIGASIFYTEIEVYCRDDIPDEGYLRLLELGWKFDGKTKWSITAKSSTKESPTRDSDKMEYLSHLKHGDLMIEALANRIPGKDLKEDVEERRKRRTPEGKKKRGSKAGKGTYVRNTGIPWVITFADGHTERTLNLSKYARDKEFRACSLYKIVMGLIKTTSNGTATIVSIDQNIF
jgi:hypothetical protein